MAHRMHRITIYATGVFEFALFIIGMVIVVEAPDGATLLGGGLVRISVITLLVIFSLRGKQWAIRSLAIFEGLTACAGIFVVFVILVSASTVNHKILAISVTTVVSVPFAIIATLNWKGRFAGTSANLL